MASLSQLEVLLSHCISCCLVLLSFILQLPLERSSLFCGFTCRSFAKELLKIYCPPIAQIVKDGFLAAKPHL